MNKILLTLILVPTLIFSQGKLDRAKTNLSEKNKTTSKKERTVSRSNNRAVSNSTSSSEGSFVEVLTEIGFYATLGVVFGVAEERDLDPYPYFDGNSSGYIKDLISKNPKKSSFRVGGDYLVAGNVKGFGINGVYKFLPILGVRASHTHFYEGTRSGSSFLDVTTLMVNYYRIREKYVDLWWGVGVSYVGNEVRKSGFSYAVNAEFYPINPISLSLKWQQSFINEEEINEFKTDLKYHFKNKAIYAGYHNFNLANEKVSGFAIGIEYQF